ncbi:selenoprotein W-related protein [Halorientalis persicus]|jgi:selenoprotein W-related protein|uniref:Selenoprotein W-related protein n=1 Tax=Halorientalis persicus TaxID=1367881 RepID=A0A1H8M5M8_9EURY|nr:Rdx family protein [Halorientalis persicus]SEO12488.1 selenoprotein W-related protein [Halorientalis persicus]
MPEVEIEYCVPCGFLDRAEDLQHVLLTTFGERLDAVTLRTGANGVFRVTVDGERVYDKQDDAFDVDEIVRRVREYV